MKFIDTIITATPEFLAGLPEDRVRFYFEHALAFLKREIGEENIFSAVVHMDEHNPHMHVCFVPLTTDKRLSAKEVMGGREKLVEWQEQFHDTCRRSSQRWSVVRLPPRPSGSTFRLGFISKQHRLTDEMTEIHNEIENIGTFNAGKQKEKVLKLLMDWYPRINAFESKLKPYDDQLKILRENESAFRYETEQAQWALQKERQEGQSLIYELREYQDFISSIPPELFEELKQRYEMGQQQQEQSFEL